MECSQEIIPLMEQIPIQKNGTYFKVLRRCPCGEMFVVGHELQKFCRRHRQKRMRVL